MEKESLPKRDREKKKKALQQLYNDHNNTLYLHATYFQELFEMAYKIKY